MTDMDHCVQFIKNSHAYDDLVRIRDDADEQLRAHDWAFFYCKEQFEDAFSNNQLNSFTNEHRGYHETETHCKMSICLADKSTVHIRCGSNMGQEYYEHNG